ncbi:MAG: hypothetical protein B0D92_01280 [Spirochaeta sp. LUC14_002_19_P3]|nr:MAG: hypothetical protein B0D92_01280 [Spirochaeta sp. LUC14_002_19_P3]
MSELSVEEKAQLIRDNVRKYTTIRLARGNMYLQRGAFRTPSEWKKRRETQAERMAFINERLQYTPSGQNDKD